MKLSIIVPIYNVAPYLRKCVDGLLAQDIADYEIILVDDGSTDGSGAIADEIVGEAMGNKQLTIGEDIPIANRPTISVIHQENAGLSAARNAGVAKAKGKYIWFVDSDDYVEFNVLGVLIEQIERDNLDVLRFRYQNVRESGEAFAPYKDMTNYNDYSSIPADGLTFLNERMGNQCYVWQFILRTKLCLKENFTPNIFFEDTDWMPRMLLQAKRVASTELVVYNYLWREGSITLTQNKSNLRKQLHDKFSLITKLNVMKNVHDDPRWFNGMISGLLLSIVEIVAQSFYQERSRYIQVIKDLNIIPIVKYHIPPRARVKVKLINISLNLTIRLIHYKNL